MTLDDWRALAWLVDYILWISAFAMLTAAIVEFWRWAWPRLKRWWAEPIRITIRTTKTGDWGDR